MGQCVRSMIKEEGIRGFYKGVTPPLFLSGLFNSILFSLNQVMSNVMTPAGHTIGTPLPLWRTALAAQLTAPLYVLCITPMEVVKVKLQIQAGRSSGGATDQKPLYRGPIDCLKQTIQAEGVSGVLRGYTTTLMSRLVGLPFYFGGYQTAKSFLMGGDRAVPNAPMPMYVPMLSGVVAGCCFWSSNFPFDFIKTQQQGSRVPVTMFEVASRTYREKGISAFYRGFGACMLRSIPANSTVWLGVEFTTQFLIARGF